MDNIAQTHSERERKRDGERNYWCLVPEHRSNHPLNLSFFSINSFRHSHCSDRRWRKPSSSIAICVRALCALQVFLPHLAESRKRCARIPSTNCLQSAHWYARVNRIEINCIRTLSKHYSPLLWQSILGLYQIYRPALHFRLQYSRLLPVGYTYLCVNGNCAPLHIHFESFVCKLNRYRSEPSCCYCCLLHCVLYAIVWECDKWQWLLTVFNDLQHMRHRSIKVQMAAPKWPNVSLLASLLARLQ